MDLFTIALLMGFLLLFVGVRRVLLRAEASRFRQQHPVSETLVEDLMNRAWPRAEHLLVPAAGPAALEAEPPAPVFFKEGEPRHFVEYDGQAHIVGLLEDAVRAAQPVLWRGAHALAIEPQLLLGFPGAGKTLLAKIVANELQERAQQLGCVVGPFLEVFPADMPDVESLDEVMRRAQNQPGSTLFIDEIHDFTGPISRKLYLVFEENRYQFHGSSGPLLLPPLSILAATTDPGGMHGALKRRMIRHQFKPASPEELLNYVVRRGRIAESVAWLIVDRTKWGGAAWEPLELYRLAAKAATARGSAAIEPTDVDRVIKMQELDELGLRWMDRAVLRALLSRSYTLKSGEVIHAASLADVCSLAQIDPGEYRESVKPRLMGRGLLSQRPGFGQCLTAAGLAKYGWLKGAT